MNLKNKIAATNTEVQREWEDDAIIKTFTVKNPDGTTEEVEIKYRRESLLEPVYLMRRE